MTVTELTMWGVAVVAVAFAAPAAVRAVVTRDPRDAGRLVIDLVAVALVAAPAELAVWLLFALGESRWGTPAAVGCAVMLAAQAVAVVEQRERFRAGLLARHGAGREGR